MTEKKSKKYVSDNARLMAEWHWEKNTALGFDPQKLTYGSTKRVWWKCTQGHEWPAIIYNRSKGKGCKKCANHVISQKLRETKLRVGENDLASQRPDLLKEWDYLQNSTIATPETITIGNSSQKVHWICSVCKHPWSATVYNRVHQDSGCPECGNRKISEKNRERNFIAFLYFYHQVKGSESADGIQRDRIVVIDDPVSSMDSSALFIVSALVREMVEVCENNAIGGDPVAKDNHIKQKCL